MPVSEILVAYSNVEGRRQLVEILEVCDLGVAIAESVSEAGALMSERPMHLGFCEEALPQGGYRELLRNTAGQGLQVPLVVCGAPEQYLAAMWAGAFDYVSPPFTQAAIKLILKRRREPRRQLKLPVDIYGVDANGIPFSQSAWTRNVSNRGALIEGISCPLQTGAVVGVRCHDRQANFRVIWISQVADGRAYEAGVEDLENGIPIWNLPTETHRSDGDSLCEDLVSLVVSQDENVTK